MISPSVALAIATLVFYVLAAPFAVFNSIRHGIRFSGPWYFMLLLVLVRLIGEPMIIATQGVFNPLDDVSLAGAILTTIGLSPLLLMAGGIIQQVNNSFKRDSAVIDSRVLHLMQLVPLVGLILGVIGNSFQYSSDKSKRTTGQNLKVATGALYIVYWVLLVVGTLSLYRARRAQQARRNHVFIVGLVASLPFLLVRVIYNCLVSFGSVENQLANGNNIAEKAVMRTLMEFIAVIIFLAAGMMSEGKPKSVEGAYQEEFANGPQYQMKREQEGQVYGSV